MVPDVAPSRQPTAGKGTMKDRRGETVSGSLHDSAARQRRATPLLQPAPRVPAVNPTLKYSAVSASVQYT